jgi:2-(1,2-epoxy-1,2-dihydrophenyl)acetyl-CoA isomerase
MAATLPDLDTVMLRRGASNGAELRIELNRPDRMNAWDKQLGLDLLAAVELAAGDESVRVVTITGAGRAFSSGADLRAGFDPRPGDGKPDVGTALRERYHPIIAGVRRMPKPVVAAVNGPAAGVGMSFALAADIAIAGKSASFLQAFARIGLLPDGGSTWFLPRLVGEQRARALAMLAPKISAEQAKEWGLIWDVVDDGELMKTATEVARGLAEGPTLSLARIKEAMNRASGNQLSQQLDLERDFQRELGRSEDFREGVSAFLAKRKPNFKGK